MRHRIELYVGGKEADLDDQGLLLYNYAFTDLQMPTAVKNSFSKQVTLPATARNLAIFGHPQRTERTTSPGTSGTGVQFNAGEKTPFELRDEAQTILESGYLRLDEVSMKGRVVQALKVTLFGGIGSFFYSLSYNEDGTKKTLADLDHGISLDALTINWQTVSNSWDRLNRHDQSQGIEYEEDVVNFAPCLNGIPDGAFDATKAIINPTLVGLPSSVQESSGGQTKTYTTKNNIAILTLKQGRDEWAMKDLRSYLQRPVYSMTAFLEAIARKANNGGFSVDYSRVPGHLYFNVWKTLPMLSSLGNVATLSGSTALLLPSRLPQSENMGRFVYATHPGAGASVHAVLSNVALTVTSENFSDLSTPSLVSRISTSSYHRLAIFVQLVARTGGVALAASPAYCYMQQGQGSFNYYATTIASTVGYVPECGAVVQENVQAMTVTRKDAYTVEFDSEIGPFTIDSVAAEEYVISYKCYLLETSVSGIVAEGIDNFTLLSRLAIMDFLNASATTYADEIYVDGFAGVADYTVQGAARSGAVIPYASILASAHTPAEYLIAFCKANGLVFGYNPNGKTVTIMPRNDWFTGEITDLSGRVDRSQEITIQPLALKTKWYELKGSIVSGALADDYQKKYGVQYGIQRVDTGYDFDADVNDLMGSLVLKGAVTLLDRSAYWNRLTASGKAIPSVFLDQGNTYTLWDGDGEGKAFQVPTPASDVTIEYYNNAFPGYDAEGCPKLEFRDASGKALDGQDVLCRYCGTGQGYERFYITDDTADMLALNNGKPCWNLVDTAAPLGVSGIPIFHRYNDLRTTPIVERSMDYGIPREVELPGVTFGETNGSLYLRAWRSYLVDLLSINTKVMKCRVDLGGLQVGPELLRRFYWYEGSMWVLNKITNYSLTTYDPVECEFVQVQDPAAYTDGQNL